MRSSHSKWGCQSKHTKIYPEKCAIVAKTACPKWVGKLTFGLFELPFCTLGSTGAPWVLKAAWKTQNGPKSRGKTVQRMPNSSNKCNAACHRRTNISWGTCTKPQGRLSKSKFHPRSTANLKQELLLCCAISGGCPELWRGNTQARRLNHVTCVCFFCNFSDETTRKHGLTWASSRLSLWVSFCLCCWH